MNTLTESDRRLLTEKVLRECWHEWAFEDSDPHGRFPYNNGFYCLNCGKQTEAKVAPSNRSFTTWQDVGDLMTALQKAGKWFAFERFATHQWSRMCYEKEYGGHNCPFTPMQWIFQPATEQGIHFAWLVAEFMKGEKA
jgi:hypothetical protein